MTAADGLAVFAIATLAAIALLHAYWGAGGRWPGHDNASLAETVIGPRGTGMAPPWACYAVTLALAIAALLVVANRGWLGAWPPTTLVRIGVFGVAGVLLLRGLGGFVDTLRPQIRGSKFARLNNRFYSPLCLVLGTAVLLSELWAK